MTTIQVPAYAAPAVQRLLNAIISHIPHWHPITEIPPIDQTRATYLSADILLYARGDGWNECRTGYYNYSNQHYVVYHDDDFKPTHWCDLPTPPEIHNESPE